jgi:hypothetical protein
LLSWRATVFDAPYWRGEALTNGRLGGLVAFISTQFLVFLLVTAAVHFMLPVRIRWMWLLAASLAFYGIGEPVFLIQMLAASAATFWFAMKIEAAPDKSAKQRLLWPAILLLVGNLVVFKYTPFFNESLQNLFWRIDVDYPFRDLVWLMPVGISFYTIQLISYLVDVFRGQKAERHAGLFTLYVTFFPKLVAGPIERAKNLLPQLHARPGFDYGLAVQGLQLAWWGAIQKVVIADRIAPFVNRVYDNPDAVNGAQIAFATFLYAFQIYADFAGYTNMALGIALIFGYRLTQNFNNPYFAVSIQDFWKRWHISLSSWLTDYVYTPLTRQKTFKIKLYDLMLYSLLITFIVSGLWHGANWTYITWGALHGVYIVGALLLQKRWNAFARAVKLTQMPNTYRALKMGVTFLLVCLAYILFRAATMDDALTIFARLPTGWDQAFSSISDTVGAEVIEFLIALAGIAVLMGADILRGRVDVGATLTAKPAALRWSVYYLGALGFVLLGAFYSVSHEFIYFRF